MKLFLFYLKVEKIITYGTNKYHSWYIYIEKEQKTILSIKTQMDKKKHDSMKLFDFVYIIQRT